MTLTQINSGPAQIGARRPALGQRPAPIVPQTMAEVQDYAVRAVASGLYRGDNVNHVDQAIAQAAMIVLKALEMGLPITFALQTMTIKEGNVIVKADAMRSLIWGAGFKLTEQIGGDGENRKAICTVTRPDRTEITRVFSVADAIRAKIYQTDPESYWQRFEDRLLAARALGFAARDGASDVVAGLYVREEFDAPVASNPAPARVIDTVPHTSARAGAVTDFDIPPEDGDTAGAPVPAVSPTLADEPDTSTESVLRRIEAAIEAGEAPELIEARHIEAINAMDQADRDRAFELIYPAP